MESTKKKARKFNGGFLIKAIITTPGIVNPDIEPAYIEVHGLPETSIIEDRHYMREQLEECFSLILGEVANIHFIDECAFCGALRTMPHDDDCETLSDNNDGVST